MPLLLDWRLASQPDDLVRQVIAVLQQGGLAALPTDAGYAIVASAAATETVHALAAYPAEHLAPLELLAATPAELERWTEPLPLSLSRLLDRLWPGPLGLVAHLRRESPGFAWFNDGTGRFRSPNHTAVSTLLPAAEFPIVGRSTIEAPGSEETAAKLAERWSDALAIVVDGGPIARQPLTWLAVTENGWRIEQTGMFNEADLLAAAARWIVFVCTGNTCRSPMAEAICKTLLAERLGCAIAELPARGFVICSAGLAAYPGDGPSPDAVDVLRDMGSDLTYHRSQPLAVDLAARADHLVAMTRSHLAAILTHYPVIGGAMRLLCGADGDLNDPIGGDREVYVACARIIRRRLARFIEELICR